MAWFTRFTRFGDVHSCFGQENRMTCGLACALMAAYKVHKFSPDANHPIDEKTVLRICDEVNGAGKILQHGVTWTELAQVLNHGDLQMPTWNLAHGLAAEAVCDEIIARVGVDYGFGPSWKCSPIILLVRWTHNNKGHWVVIDSVRNVLGLNYATLCDPLDAAVHIIPLHKGEPFSYSAQRTIQRNFWGKDPIHDFETPRTAVADFSSSQNVKTHYSRMAVTYLLYRDPLPEGTFELPAHLRKFDDLHPTGLRGDRAGDF